MKEETFDYSKVPHNFGLCATDTCPYTDTCLRRIAYTYAPSNNIFLYVLNPKAIESTAGKCKYYCSNKKVRYAKGFMNILDNLPYNQRRSIIVSLIAYFGQRTYYRSRKGERLLTPDEQQAVLNIIKRHNATTSQEFDGYEEDYLW